MYYGTGGRTGKNTEKECSKIKQNFEKTEGFYMKKKFLCMLLSAAMLFTTGDFSELTLVQAKETQETVEETEEVQEARSAGFERDRKSVV